MDGKEISLIDYLDISIETVRSHYNNAINQKSSLNKITNLAIGLKRTILEKEYYMKYQGYIINGLFKGMKYLPIARNSVLMPKLLGTYESEVSNYLMSIGKDIDHFLSIGCAEGYYVAGIPYKFPNVTSAGVDIDPQCINLTSILCEINGLTQRTSFGTNLNKALKDITGKALILIDVDGDEINIISQIIKQKDKYKYLINLKLLVETDFHENGNSNEKEIIAFLLENNFNIEYIIEQDIVNRFGSFTEGWSPLDRFIAGYERPSIDQKWIVANEKSLR